MCRGVARKEQSTGRRLEARIRRWLISFGLDWNASDPLHVILDGDAAVGPAGRAEDVFLGLGWAFDPTARLTLGWRILEGGADVDESRNFTMVDFASLGFRLIL